MDILNNLTNMFGRKEEISLSADEMAEILKTSPEALEEFEKSYKSASFQKGISDNYFEINAKQAKEMKEPVLTEEAPDDLIDRIVKELVAETSVYTYEKKKQYITDFSALIGENKTVTAEDLETLPKEVRPQCTGNLMPQGIPGTGGSLLYNLERMKTAKSDKERSQWYHMFRQGLDILDLDALTYAMINMNRVSMGYWLPKITAAVDIEGFFRIPDTKIIKVPLPLLQLPRVFEYPELTPSTVDMINRYCMEVFGLDVNKKYFIKTGTSSSKRDFRNALVEGEKEIRELGEYLFFIHQQQCQMAAPLSSPSIYGAGTTVEWVVREFIEDKENNPQIYHGLPLHT